MIDDSSNRYVETRFSHIFFTIFIYVLVTVGIVISIAILFNKTSSLSLIIFGVILCIASITLYRKRHYVHKRLVKRNVVFQNWLIGEENNGSYKQNASSQNNSSHHAGSLHNRLSRMNTLDDMNTFPLSDFEKNNWNRIITMLDEEFFDPKNDKKHRNNRKRLDK